MGVHNVLVRGWLGIVASAAAMAALTASAKTVALWPVEYDSARGAFDYRCRINPTNDLYDPASKNTLTNGTGRVLPPNPDASVRNAFALNAIAVSNTNTTQSAAMLKNDYAGAYVVGTNDFTLEGFFKLNALPASGSFFILASWIPNDEAKRFMFTLRTDATSHPGICFDMYGILLTGKTDIYSAPLSADAVVALTNSWHHFAIVYRHNTSAGKAETTVYVDGTQQLAKSVTAITQLSTAPKNTYLEFGGRTGGNRRASVQLDYLRLSDEALDPSEFLNAGGAGTAAAEPSPTVAYWKLSADEAGIDGTSSVGGYPLGDVWQSDQTNIVTLAHLETSRESAFAGLPPNTAMSPAAALAATNVGSLHPLHDWVTLWHPTLGNALTVTNGFTVEGWLKPERSLNYSENYEMVFNTRDGTFNHVETGWNFGFIQKSGKWVFYVYANDGKNVLCNNTPLSGALDEWTDWRHVALVYDANDGNGTWSLYMDGELTGCATNAAAPDVAMQASRARGNFWLGGRFTNLNNRNFRGGIDYVRVSKAVLRPDQFLNATNGAAAMNVLGLWPLDVINGIYLDGRDATGQNHLQSPRVRKGNVVSYHASPDMADTPTVTNPDTSPAFTGDPAATAGCVDFGDNSSERHGYLGTRVPATLKAVNTKAGLTLEGYFKRTAVPDDDWDVYFGFYNSAKKDSLGSILNLGVYKDRGFIVYDNNWATNWPYTGSNNINNMDFSQTVPDLTLDEWRHVAFTRTFTPTSVVWECFINGVSQGISSESKLCTTGSTPAHAVEIMFVGGRYTTRNHFKGKVSSIRVSNRVLATSEFLCATGPAPADPETFGAWPTVATPVTLMNHSLFTAPARPFTIEYMASLADGAETLLAGTWDETKKVGWRVVRAANGDVSAYARVDSKSSPYATGTFGTVPAGITAVAVVYDPYDGKGTWTLYANGGRIGTVENLWTPSASTATQPWPLTIGAETMGTLSRARFTGVALGADGLLYVPGLAVILR